MNIALGRNTAEKKSTSDFDTYKTCMTNLKKELVTLKKRNPYFIVQSRKGPKVLEMFFSKEERLNMKILTEHALPFLFPILAKDKTKRYSIIIIDDAIYYGTTIENLISEIKDYEKLYGVQVQIKICTAIKAMWSKEIRETDILPKGNSIRKGYEHYFVNLLMSDIRSIPTSLEVEFPIVTYRTNKHINQSDLQAQIKKFYDHRGRLYDVEQYHSTTFEEEGGGRFSILLNNDNGASFSKMRFYIDKNAIRVAFISPHLIPNNISAIEHIFENGTEFVKNTWNLIMKIVFNEHKPTYNGTIYRNRQRTLVIVANFLLSLHLYFKENDILQKIISFLTGGEEIKTDFDEQQLRLRYIFFDDEIVSNILLIMEEYKNSPNTFSPNLYSYKQAFSKNQIFETTGYPPDSEKEKLQDFNACMLKNSKNMSEKLSALFFNQTTLIEKWSRQFGDNTSNRLKFGYSFRGLLSALEINYKDEALIESNSIYRVHRWIDRRIDQGCIVPQYIIDNEKEQWDRVFRPGENEDAILSTLTRFVTYVINVIKKEFGVYYIPELILKKILCLIVKQCESNLQDLLRIKLVILGTGLSFICEDDYGEKNNTNDIVDYLKAMLVLENSDNFIDISKRFIGTEQVMNTTFSTEVEKDIASIIEKFHEKLTVCKIDFLTSYSLCNCFLITYFTSEQKEEECVKSLEKLSTAASMLSQKKNELAKTEAEKCIYEAFCSLKLFIMPRTFLEIPMHNQQLYEPHIYIYQKKFSRILFVINLLLHMFYSSNTYRLTGYVDTIDTDYSDYLGSSTLLNSIKTALGKEKSITQIAGNQGQMKRLLEYVNEIKRINE